MKRIIRDTRDQRLELCGVRTESPGIVVGSLNRWKERTVDTKSGTSDGNCVPKGEDTVEESEKFGFKLNIQKTKIMASSPITPW